MHLWAWELAGWWTHHRLAPWYLLHTPLMLPPQSSERRASETSARLPNNDIPDVHSLILERTNPSWASNLDLSPPDRSSLLILKVQHHRIVHPLLKDPITSTYG